MKNWIFLSNSLKCALKFLKDMDRIHLKNANINWFEVEKSKHSNTSHIIIGSFDYQCSRATIITRFKSDWFFFCPSCQIFVASYCQCHSIICSRINHIVNCERARHRSAICCKEKDEIKCSKYWANLIKGCHPSLLIYLKSKGHLHRFKLHQIF